MHYAPVGGLDWEPWRRCWDGGASRVRQAYIGTVQCWLRSLHRFIRIHLGQSLGNTRKYLGDPWRLHSIADTSFTIFHSISDHSHPFTVMNDERRLSFSMAKVDGELPSLWDFVDSSSTAKDTMREFGSWGECRSFEHLSILFYPFFNFGFRLTQ